MTAPVLSVAASGYGGRGYVIPTRPDAEGRPARYLGVTTALGVLDKPGILTWTIDNTIAYAMHNIDRLVDMEPHQQFGFLRFYHSRFKEADFDDPLKDISDASSGVLNDLAELGTLTHTWIEDNLNGRFEPEIFREEQAEMIEAFLEWKAGHRIQVVLSEATVVGENWAGTLDHLLIIECLHDGPTCLGQPSGVAVPTLVDVKGLPLDTEIPTPTGWTTMGELKKGDVVFDSNGEKTTVTLKSEVHYNPCYELTFDTGETITADHEHRWVVEVGPTTRNPKTKVMTTQEIAERIKGRKGQKDMRILNAKAIQMPEADLPLDPYVLGVWLGDGTATKNEITLNDSTKQGIVPELESRGWQVTVVEYPSDPESHSVRIRLGGSGEFKNGGISDFKAKLREIGVVGNKHIPQEYMRASESQRLDLLRGLLDTDGSVNKARNNEVCYSSTDSRSVDQVAELVSSLGWRSYKASNGVSWTHKEVKKYTTAYKVTFRPYGTNPFLARAVDIPESTQSKYRIIRSAEPVDMVPTQCITVDSPEETYLFGRSMIVTHNTSRRTRREHIAQLAALGAAQSLMREVLPGTPGAVAYKERWWIEDVLPSFSEYAILHVRPGEVGNGGVYTEPFCKLKRVPYAKVDAGFKLFEAAVAARLAERELKQLDKELGDL